MKNLFKVLALIICFTLCFSILGCNKDNNENNSGNNNQQQQDPSGEGDGDDSFIARTRSTVDECKIIDAEYNYGDASAWAGNSYSYLDLGTVNLQDVVEDYVYDWGHSIIKEGDLYKMWWVRPATLDAIFYAESKDLKNWSNVQRVICFSPNATNIKRYTYLKGMLGKPSVIKVDGTYYMYFETPATEDPDLTQTVLEFDNQVMLATSTDGINWNIYSDDQGQPKPIITVESQYMGDFNNKNYGAGQPSVFYKDGTFYLTYCYVIYSAGIAEIRVATSTDGVTFGNTTSHSKIADGNGKGVTYNTKTNKYMMIGGDVVESNTLNFVGGQSYKVQETDTGIQTGFYEFIKNEHGLIDTESFYFIHLQGQKSLTQDWRGAHTTWDGHIHAANPCEYKNRTITLPNGAAATTSNVNQYKDKVVKYSKLTADAIYASDSNIKIDGEFDDSYKGATEIIIERPTYSWGSNLTSTWGKAYLAWNEDYLYCFAKVYDNTPDTSYQLTSSKVSYMHDSLDIYVDVPNDHGNNHQVGYGIEQYMICVDSNNTNFIIKGSDEYDLTSDFTGTRRRIKKTEFGYIIEVRVAWHDLVKDQIEQDKCIGIDFNINDAMGNKVGREAMVVWNDHTGESYRYTENMGDVYLIKK